MSASGTQPTAPSTKAHVRKTVSTRYDARTVEWMMGRLGVTKSELLKLALDDLLVRVMKEEAA